MCLCPIGHPGLRSKTANSVNKPVIPHKPLLCYRNAKIREACADPFSCLVAERARSISPQKSSPANTPPPSSQRLSRTHVSGPDGLKLGASPLLASPASPSARAALQIDTTDASTDYSTSPTKENYPLSDSDTKRSSATLTSPSTAGLPARSPLSWQRRPTSQTSERPKSRPLSIVATENATARSTTSAEQALAEQNPSKEQIAQALSGKDPAWFRQTPDRGLSSAAYRRNQVEDEDTLDMTSVRAQLPGMARDSSMDRPKEPSDPLPTSPASQGKFGSPLVLSSAQRFDPPSTGASAEDASAFVDRQAVTSPGGRTSPTRPLSPTKGMGGFVQSAMMKRSDSVKRWSVNSSTGLQRADSTVSNRTGLDHSQRTSTPKENSHRTSLLREESRTPSRPTSSDGQEPGNTDEKPGAGPKEDEENATLPTSPSKTMDPRRWSPTKSSWLETALNKPESPKPKPTPPPSNQPAWMVELNKARAQRANNGSVDLGRNSPVPRKHEVKTGGLMRSSPMGTNVKPTGLGGLGGVGLAPVIPAGDKTPVASLRGSLSRRASEAGTEEAEGATSSSDTAKPETPPKKDFRTNLKPRQPQPEPGGPGQKDELKNVFGGLRRTKTQNYVAPDELKNNILRGKAALNLTGGPKKTERKDEFKEAILKKKEEFIKAQQEGRGATRRSSTSSEKTIPEGLAKKMELNRSSTTSKRDSAVSDAPSEFLSRTSASNRSSTISTLSGRESADITPLSTPKASTWVEKDIPATLPALQKEISAPGRLQNRPGGSALADRFNPALAGILARGPPGAGSGPTKGSGGSPTQASSGGDELGSASSGPQLTHMTKNRARGPKRNTPSSVAKSAGDTKAAEPAPASAPAPAPALVPEKKTPLGAEAEKRDIKPPMSKPTSQGKPAPLALARKPEVVALADSSKVASKEKPAPPRQVISLVDSSKKIVAEGPRSAGHPISFGDSPGYKPRPRSPTKVHEQVAALAAKSQPVAKAANEKEDPVSQPSSPKKLNLNRLSKFFDESGQTGSKVEGEEARPSSPTKSRPLPEPVSSASQSKADDKVDSDPVVSVKNAKTLFGGPALGHAEAGRPRSPPKGASKPLPLPPTSGVTSPPLASPARSPTKSSLEISAALTEFFGPERPKRNYNVDTADILARRPAAGPKIRTQKVQLFQVSGDGKKQPVPAHYERVLFEREMYLCPHTYVNESGRKVNEVYFWAGDEVPESAVEDAHVFIQREARSFGGKLIKLTQGKETPEFIQALGGIIIVRRGSSNKYDSLAPNMLCGRRYLGEIVFDEVDFSPASLCSGFPYLITQQGQCYLWKGKGSDVAELSCARLVGMDVALMGELSEIEDGKEPANFWNIFDGGAKPSSADHWRLKPNYDKYCGRLFHSDAADRKQVSEAQAHPSREDISLTSSRHRS